MRLLCFAAALAMLAALGGCLSSRPAVPEAPVPAAQAPSRAPAAPPSSPAPAEAPEPTLPPPQDPGAPEAHPTPEPLPPELSVYEALRQAARLTPPETRLLTVGGRVPLLLYDINRDGDPECFAVAVKNPRLKPAEIEALSQSARVFDPNAAPAAFALLVYGNEQGSLRRPLLVELGERRVFEALTRTPLYAGRALPLVVKVSFLNQDGREQELLVFDGGTAPRFRRGLTESLTARSWLEDIDADGALDLLTRERVLEEGVGYETFLTWSRWNGRAFVEIQTRSLLRGLAGFLASLREALRAGSPRRIAELAADPREFERLRSRGGSEEAATLALLGLDKAGLKALPRAAEVVFPEILEDPFTARDAAGQYFQLAYRLVDDSGLVFLPRTRLYLLRNPFGERPFGLRPAAD